MAKNMQDNETLVDGIMTVIEGSGQRQAATLEELNEGLRKSSLEFDNPSLLGTVLDWLVEAKILLRDLPEAVFELYDFEHSGLTRERIFEHIDDAVFVYRINYEKPESSKSESPSKTLTRNDTALNLRNRTIHRVSYE